MHTTLIAVTTLDGRIGPGLVGSAADRAHLEAARMRTDASLIGAGTLRAGQVEMRGRGGIIPPDRIRAVITASGSLPLDDRKLFREGPPPVVFTAQQHAGSLQDAAGDRARVVGIDTGRGGLSVRAALAQLAAMGASSVLIEGGARLNHAALAEDVVDEILLTLSPRIGGRRGDPALADGDDPLGVPWRDLELVGHRAEDTGELFLRYRVGDDHGGR